MLHAAYAVSCLFDTVAPTDDETDEPFGLEDMWGCKISKKVLNILLQDITTSFNEAAKVGRRIEIWGKKYSIRRCNAYDPKRIHLIFDFPGEGDEFTITKEGIKNLSGEVPESLQKYEVTLEESRANKLYLRQVIKLAEDDKNNGWDKLTDMEVTMYCWALYYNKHQSDNLIEFMRLYKDYIYIKVSELKSCFTEKAKFRERPFGMYTFSERKVKEWNEAARQKSVASEITKEEADDYWYDVAIKNTFKSVDCI